MNKNLIVTAALLLIGLGACSEQKSESDQTKAAPEATQTKGSGSTAEPAGGEIKKPEPSAQATAEDTESITNKACLAAVSSETGESDVAILSNEFSEANTLVMVGVGTQRAPWRCLVSNDGTVAEVSFTGSDSGGGDVNASSDQTKTATSSEVSEAAVNACLSAVTAETSESNVSVISTEFSEANSLVMVGVGADRAPWRCLVSNDGEVAEVSFAGSEGKL